MSEYRVPALLFVLVLAVAVGIAGWIGYRATEPEELKACYAVGTGEQLPQGVGLACISGDKATIYYPLQQTAPKPKP